MYEDVLCVGRCFVYVSACGCGGLHVVKWVSCVCGGCVEVCAPHVHVCREGEDVGFLV